MITSIPTITAADILILDHLSRYDLDSAKIMPWQTTALGIFDEVRAVPVAVVYRHLNKLKKAELVAKHNRWIIKDTIPKDRTRFGKAIASYTITHGGRELLGVYRNLFIVGEPARMVLKAEGVPS